VLLGTSAGCGTVYELSPPAKNGDPWTETLLYSFKSGNDGYFPWGVLTFDAKGNLYGATQFGGGKGSTCNVFYGGNCGTVFELGPPKQKGGRWTEKVLHSFGGGTHGANPNGGLILGKQGTIYGMTQGGGYQGCNANASGCGIAFELEPPGKKGGVWKQDILHVFMDGNDGALPDFGLIFDTRRSGFYGSTRAGGSNGRGVVFHLSKEGAKYHETPLYSFTGGFDGLDPSRPTLDSSGQLYGTAVGGGPDFAGTVFRLNKNSKGQWAFAVLYTFGGVSHGDGADPASGIIFDKAGNAFGTTEAGGTGQNCGQSGCGAVFEVSPK
jgi:uncharacterized repeat protein (TIGR03803 family)